MVGAIIVSVLVVTILLLICYIILLEIVVKDQEKKIDMLIRINYGNSELK